MTGTTAAHPYHNGSIEAVTDSLPCPCCGCTTWTDISGMGVFCIMCNTEMHVQPTAGDAGYIVTFKDDDAWPTAQKRPLPDNAHIMVKLLGWTDPDIHWTTVRDQSTGDIIDWTPVWQHSDKTPRQDHDGGMC